jgi:GTP-binding protein Era
VANETFRSGFVALVGRPNVGKSTLLNRLVGTKVAIMSDKPQTTRHRITAVLHRPEAQIVFLDTPGIHRPHHLLGEYMLRAARQALDGVDAACLVVDATSPLPGGGDRYVAQLLRGAEAPVFLSVNKVDAVDPEVLPAVLGAYGRLGRFAAVLPLSALHGDGVEDLIRALVAVLPEGPAYFPEDAVTDRPEQFLMAELIREQVFHLTRDEVPHATTVELDEVTRRNGGTLYVAATIYVERESQKGIVIGRGGQMLGSIGARARAEIEALLGSHLFLDLRVKVRENWRNRAGSLQSLGYRL